VIVTCVNVWVKLENIEEFIAASVENHNNSVNEPGNLRFDLLQNSLDPCRFTLYEAYESDEAAAAHKQTAHYSKWRETVAPWMAKPREGLVHNVIAPADYKRWK
jgi:(4S)-4-hydroxy-5-phosphonooxypentane-2,3-dione isomerase